MIQYDLIRFIGFLESHPVTATLTTTFGIFFLGGLGSLIKIIFSPSEKKRESETKSIRNIKTDGGKYVEGNDNSVNSALYKDGKF